MKILYFIISVLCFFNYYCLTFVNSERLECSKRYFSNSYYSNSFICICNSSYCDNVEPIDFDNKTEYFQQYITSKDVYRLDKFKTKFSFSEKKFQNQINFRINTTVQFQKIKGFGGAITDSAGFNIFGLSDKTRENLINSYFDSDGIQYNILRVPLAGVDFSIREYSYDDFANDFELKNFSLSEEDTNWKIPFIQTAIKVSQKPISFFASAWTAPTWMKTNNDYKGNGTLIGPIAGRYYQTWADYYLKFFQAYQKYNISFWAMTAQNEPTDGYLFKFSFNCMGFTPESQAEFIIENLGPTLKNNGFENIKIMILDDQRLFLETWPEAVFNYSPDAKKYIDGIAVHWYLDFAVGPKILDYTHNLYPDKFIFGTEACAGAGPLKPNVQIGAFGRAESYARSILQDLNHWVTGWTDWNIALDLNGGPNWANNFVDSPILVNKTADEFLKQPMFYAMGHFSKFIDENSVRIDLIEETPNISSLLSYAAFYSKKDKKIVFVILNESNNDTSISIFDPIINKNLSFTIEAHSIQTLIWFN